MISNDTLVARYRNRNSITQSSNFLPHRGEDRKTDWNAKVGHGVDEFSHSIKSSGHDVDVDLSSERPRLSDTFGLDAMSYPFSKVEEKLLAGGGCVLKLGICSSHDFAGYSRLD